MHIYSLLKIDFPTKKMLDLPFNLYSIYHTPQRNFPQIEVLGKDDLGLFDPLIQ